MRLITLKQRLRTYNKSDVYSKVYDKANLIYIHIPKAAGTSICDAIFRDDPWHFSADELRFINRKKFDTYKKIAFVRNPIDRIVSTYLYSKTHIEKNPNTSINFLKDVDSIDDFVERFLDAKLVEEHYFFWTQDLYIGDEVSFIGKFENIKSDFIKLKDSFGIKNDIEHKNKSKKSKEIINIKKSNLDKIIDLYSKDFERFGYDKSATSNVKVTE